jgi:hypothetical protein
MEWTGSSLVARMRFFFSLAGLLLCSIFGVGPVTSVEILCDFAPEDKNDDSGDEGYARDGILFLGMSGDWHGYVITGSFHWGRHSSEDRDPLVRFRDWLEKLKFAPAQLDDISDETPFRYYLAILLSRQQQTTYLFADAWFGTRIFRSR